MMARTRRVRGQVTVETALMFGVLVAGFVAMALYLQRGAQGGLKSNADSWGTQFSSKNPWTSTTTSKTVENSKSITSDQTTAYKQTVN